MEYALGTNPSSSASKSSPVVGVEAGRFTLSFFRAQSDVTFYVEVSFGLVAWTPVATNPGTVGQAVVVADTAALAPSNSPQRFLRLRVTPN